jgi:GWxTD domain-containing protein
MKKLFVILFVISSSLFYANVTVYFNYAVFNTGSNKPYLETYLTISGNSVKYKSVNGGFQANVSVSWISKGLEVVKSSSYNLLSPLVIDSTNKQSFIDNQRFSLPNGNYVVEFTITDNAIPAKQTNHSEKITILFNRDKKIANSDIQVLESFTKAKTASNLSKNGYELIPYTVNYYPKTQNSLKFYFETYNLDTVFTKNTKCVYLYYIENSETLKIQNGFSGFQKQTAQHVNPLLNQIDITNLPTGNYNLVIEVKDSLNITHVQKKWFFQRQSDAVDKSVVGINANIKTVEEYFNTVQTYDSLKQFTECLWPRSTTKEREWQQLQITKKEPSLMRSYLVDYWKAEAGDTANALALWISYYKSVLETKALFKCGKQMGYYTDRGRVYLQYGQPNQRSQVNSEPNTYPYEIWQYYRIYDKATGRFFSNKKFVFVNSAISDDCYKLIHSDLRGEIYDEKWRFRLVSRSQQNQNVDDTKPASTYGSNMDDNFNNPR